MKNMDDVSPLKHVLLFPGGGDDRMKYGGYTHTTMPLKEGWGIIQYIRDKPHPSWENTLWYVYHWCRSAGVHMNRTFREESTICPLCSKSIPDEIQGFLVLCQSEYGST